MASLNESDVSGRRKVAFLRNRIRTLFFGFDCPTIAGVRKYQGGWEFPAISSMGIPDRDPPEGMLPLGVPRQPCEHRCYYRFCPKSGTISKILVPNERSSGVSGARLLH